MGDISAVLVQSTTSLSQLSSHVAQLDQTLAQGTSVLGSFRIKRRRELIPTDELDLIRSNSITDAKAKFSMLHERITNALFELQTEVEQTERKRRRISDDIRQEVSKFVEEKNKSIAAEVDSELLKQRDLRTQISELENSLHHLNEYVIPDAEHRINQLHARRDQRTVVKAQKAQQVVDLQKRLKMLEDEATATQNEIEERKATIRAKVEERKQLLLSTAQMVDAARQQVEFLRSDLEKRLPGTEEAAVEMLSQALRRDLADEEAKMRRWTAQSSSLSASSSSSSTSTSSSSSTSDTVQEQQQQQVQAHAHAQAIQLSSLMRLLAPNAAIAPTLGRVFDAALTAEGKSVAASMLAAQTGFSRQGYTDAVGILQRWGVITVARNGDISLSDAFQPANKL